MQQECPIIEPTKVILPDLETLQKQASAFAKSLRPLEEHATLVTLSGELGAGKTSFTQGMAQAFGISEPITSPTFVLQKMYELENQLFSTLVHMDAYRLEGDQSLQPLRFKEVYTDSNALIVLEWPERVASQLPKADYVLTLSVLDEGRELIYA